MAGKAGGRAAGNCPRTWLALQTAGVHELFAVALVLYVLNVRKDDPLFCDLMITAARCPADQVLFRPRAGSSITSPRSRGRDAGVPGQAGWPAPG
jgi:hypothetical protein